MVLQSHSVWGTPGCSASLWPSLPQDSSILTASVRSLHCDQAKHRRGAVPRNMLCIGTDVQAKPLTDANTRGSNSCSLREPSSTYIVGSIFTSQEASFMLFEKTGEITIWNGHIHTCTLGDREQYVKLAAPQLSMGAHGTTVGHQQIYPFGSYNRDFKALGREACPCNEEVYRTSHGHPFAWW